MNQRTLLKQQNLFSGAFRFRRFGRRNNRISSDDLGRTRLRSHVRSWRCVKERLVRVKTAVGEGIVLGKSEKIKHIFDFALSFVIFERKLKNALFDTENFQP